MQNVLLLSNAELKALTEKLADAVVEKLSASYAAATPIEQPINNNPSSSDKPMSSKEAADFLKITLTTLHEYKKSGKIKSFRMGKKRILFWRHDLIAYMKQLQTTGDLKLQPNV